MSLLPTGFQAQAGGSMDNLPAAHSTQEGHVGTHHCKGVVGTGMCFEALLAQEAAARPLGTYLARLVVSDQIPEIGNINSTGAIREAIKR